METNIAVEIAQEFMTVKKLFDNFGFELVGTNEINNDKLFIVKKRKKVKE